MSKVRVPWGMGVVVHPRDVRWKGTSHQWFRSGARMRRIFPTTWLHMWSVSWVASQRARGRAGQTEAAVGRVICGLQEEVGSE